jgi:hypothetical protein
MSTLDGCVTRPPTIAHVHIGHAITAVHVTPGHLGYVPLAAQRTDEALTAARAAAHATDLSDLKRNVVAVSIACDNPAEFGVKQALTFAANHIAFAATSADASENVIHFAPEFKASIAPLLTRCDYLEALDRDVQNSRSLQEGSVIAQEILKTALANVQGDMSTGAPGEGGSQVGMAQLRSELDAMVARERPPYRTVDQWYLFNLVRLPNGLWVFDRLGRGGNIDGYK